MLGQCHAPLGMIFAAQLSLQVWVLWLTPHPKSTKWSRRGLGMAQRREVWRELCWSSATFTLARLWWHQCPWSSRLYISLSLKQNLKAPLGWGTGHHGWHRWKQHGVSKAGACLLLPQCPWNCRICFSDPYHLPQTGLGPPACWTCIFYVQRGLFQTQFALFFIYYVPQICCLFITKSCYCCKSFTENRAFHLVLHCLNTGSFHKLYSS